MILLRAMTAGEGGRLGIVENPARTLGVRVGGRRADIVVAASGLVLPETGGMSVSPPPPDNLLEHRRPPEYGGIGKDPIWELQSDALPPELTYRPDPSKPRSHGFVEPAWPMLLDDYLDALRSTRGLWRLH